MYIQNMTVTQVLYNLSMGKAIRMPKNKNNDIDITLIQKDNDIAIILEAKGKKEAALQSLDEVRALLEKVAAMKKIPVEVYEKGEFNIAITPKQLESSR